MTTTAENGRFLESAMDEARESGKLEQRSWWNWFLLAGVLILTTIGLVSVVPAFMSDELTNPWLWPQTERALAVGYGLLIVALIVYLTYNQRHISELRRHLSVVREEAEKRREQYSARLYALSDVSQIMGLETDPQSVFDRITKVCVEAFECDQASLMLFNKDTSKLEVRSAHGHLDLSKVLHSEQSIGKGIAGLAAIHRKALVIGGQHQNLDIPESQVRSDALTSAMVVPILLRNELVGVLNVSSRTPEVEYCEEDLRAVSVFAGNAGACIRHAEHAQWMRQSIQNLQERLGIAV
jgi:putative methionine-R-sulfoxide reductase with GAF domain